MNQLKDIESQYKEIEAKKEILTFLKLFGIAENVNSIISAEYKQPEITFKLESKKEFIKFYKLFENSAAEIYIKSDGTTGIEPIKNTEVILFDGYHRIKTNFNFYFETQPDKYGNKEIKFKFFVYWPAKDKFLNFWIETQQDFFKDFIIKESFIDTYETQKAREYNKRHADIYTNRIILNGLANIKFYGGHCYFYSDSDGTKETILNIIESV